MTYCRATTAGCLLVVISILIGPGCGSRGGDRWTKDRPPVHFTSGQVLLDGEPVDGATVTFQPIDQGGKPGFAVTDKKGNFEVQTFDPGDGLTAGKHRVSIQKTEMVDSSGNVVREVKDEGTDLKEKHFLPEKYADFTTSGLEVEIKADTKNKLEPFDLTP